MDIRWKDAMEGFIRELEVFLSGISDKTLIVLSSMNWPTKNANNDPSDRRPSDVKVRL